MLQDAAQDLQNKMRILLIDGANNFIRNYASLPTLDSSGNAFGGVYGFLMSMKNIVRLSKPDKVLIAWDGEGGSATRRSILKDYKNRSKPFNINRNYDYGEDGEQNKILQMKRLSEYLDDLPVHQVNIKAVEADDIIAYFCNKDEENLKIVFSNDKDFYQLLSDNTIIYRPTKKIFYTRKHLKDEFGIHPNNFLLARAVAGDNSDHIKGVPRVGLKNLLKYFPEIRQKKELFVKDIVEISKDKINNKDKKYNKFLEHQEIIKRNYKLMDLSEPMININQVRKIDKILEQPLKYNKTFFRLKMREDGIVKIGESFFTEFKTLHYKNNKEEG